MKERPILFSAPMVRAILDGSKTQTRRVVKPQGTRCEPELMPDGKTTGWRINVPHAHGATHVVTSPYGVPSDRLWVRETFRAIDGRALVTERRDGIMYRADDGSGFDCGPGSDVSWKPSIFMPRWASRITLEVTEVRIEPLQRISHDDACAEGITSQRGGKAACVERYRDLWESINGAGSWEVNPWVWVVTFRRFT